MSFSDVHPGDPMNAVNVQQVIDALKGTAGKGVPLVVDAVNDSTRYALTLQNDDAVNSRAINVLKSDGTVMIAADATGVTLGSPLNLQPNSVPGAAIANASITNAKLGPDVARANLLTNGGFEINQRNAAGGQIVGAIAGPIYTLDRWYVQTGGGAASLGASRIASSIGSPGSSANVVYTHVAGASGTFGQPLEAPIQLVSRPVTFAVTVKASVPGAVKAAIAYTGGTYASAYNTTTGSERLSVTATLPASTSVLIVAIVMDVATVTVEVNDAMLVAGEVASNYVPLHPADDFARCLRCYETLGATNTATLLLTQVYSAIGATGVWNYKAVKAVTPTVTTTAATNFGMLNATAGLVACTSVGTTNADTAKVTINPGVASGLAAGNASMLIANSGATSAILTAEANA